MAGERYLLPLNLASHLWVDSDECWRIGADYELEVTLRIGSHTKARYESHEGWEESAALSYTLTRNFALAVRWNSEYGTGAGIRVRF